MPRPLPGSRPESQVGSRDHEVESIDARLVQIINAAQGTDGWAESPSNPAHRISEAEDTLRAIRAGEVDAFVVSDGTLDRRVFTLSTADRPYRMFVENMRDGAATLSASGLILFANQRLAELLSWPRETIIGSPLATFVADGDMSELESILVLGGPGATLELELLGARGVVVPVLVGTSSLEVDGEHLICLTFTDLTTQKAQDREIAILGQAQADRMAALQDAQAALTQQATHDALTGLPNRALVIDRIEQALFRAKRTGLYTVVLFVDLDRFKQVNDIHGHAAGDALLRRIADQLLEILRPMDSVARIGGDEFIVLAPDVVSHLDAVDIGNRVVTALCRHPDGMGDSEHVGASIGIAVSVGGRGTAEDLIKNADKAMYQAKALGGRRAEVFDAGLARQAQERLIAQRLLGSALNERRIIAYYQPIVDVTTGNIAGFEALARLAARDGSILPPAAFIPAAEETGLVVALGTQVLELACKEARLWQTARPTESQLTVAVNVSSRQLESGDLTTLVREALEQTGLDPTCLHLELTETAIINLRPDILAQLGGIRDLGVQIGLDDFGTGYSSLTHLSRLPLDFVKIDRSFVGGLGTDEADERIVSAVVDLAANLGLRSIAEGVETQDQLEHLRGLGCDQAQGYLFARPLSPKDVLSNGQLSSW